MPKPSKPRCPKCGSKSLSEKVSPDGSIRHECPFWCGYLMTWRPRRPIEEYRNEAKR